MEQPESKLPLLSIVIPCFNEADVFPQLRVRLEALADELSEACNTEFVLVDDGSRDDTWPQIAKFAASDVRVRALSMSRNFGQQAAITCGYDEACGDAVVCLDADLQDPPEIISEMVVRWKEGADVVLAVRRKREGETHLKLVTARLFYRFLRAVSDTDLSVDAGDFRLLSRRSLDALISLRERHRYVRGMVGWIGFRTETVFYERQARAAGTTKFSWSKMIAFALDGLLSFSFAPLRLAFLFAAISSAPIVSYVVYSFGVHIFFKGHFEAGWASIMLSITSFAILNLVCLGIVGEYVGRLYDEVKQRPIYIVRETAGLGCVSKDWSVQRSSNGNGRCRGQAVNEGRTGHSDI